MLIHLCHPKPLQTEPTMLLRVKKYFLRQRKSTFHFHEYDMTCRAPRQCNRTSILSPWQTMPPVGCLYLPDIHQFAECTLASTDWTINPYTWLHGLQSKTLRTCDVQRSISKEASPAGGRGKRSKGVDVKGGSVYNDIWWLRSKPGYLPKTRVHALCIRQGFTTIDLARDFRLGRETMHSALNL